MLLLALTLPGCRGGSLEEVPLSECKSGLRWEGSHGHTPEMFPGRDCVGCHEDEGEGPRFAVAGTVYSAPQEPDDCAGVEGVDVVITDADGQGWALTTNRAGNFFLKADVAFPIQAEVVDGDESAAMQLLVDTGRCATCHLPEGRGSANARIVIPSAL